MKHPFKYYIGALLVAVPLLAVFIAAVKYAPFFAAGMGVGLMVVTGAKLMAENSND